ncbi:MAG TPA: hypothetical protein VES67_20945 [Vicinamibacterales bacterium]|nr:hypothetical protein [Vicinamibacterales bacterium]
MHEYIEIQFKKKNKPLRVKRQLQGGIEFDESDPLERTLGIEFNHDNEITRIRMDSIRRIHGWEPGQFKLLMSVEDGSIVLRGVNEHSLPEGRYRIGVQIEEAKTKRAVTAAVDHDDHAVVAIDVEMDERAVEVDLDEIDDQIGVVLDSSSVDGLAAGDWLADTSFRATRQACLLNLLAFLRTRPTLTSPLVSQVHEVFFVSNDRVYAKVDRGFLDTLQGLADDPTRPFYAEGTPHSEVHGRLLTALPESPDTRARFGGLKSFRAEGKPSLQAVVVVPPADLPHTYAEFDLDLGNPLQDIVGFFVHMGELLDGKPTNHLDMRKDLVKTKAKDFLYYTVVQP